MPTARSSNGGVQLAMPNVVDISPFRSFQSPQQSIRGGNLLLPGSTPAPNCFAPQVLQAGDPLLSKRVVEEVPLEAIGSCRIEKAVNDLVAAMRNSGASGLSAPQIGHALQIIALEDPTLQPFKLMVIINPKLTVINPEETEPSLEECPSICGYCALVERFSQVEVSGLNRRGEKIQMVAKGWLARALQHECDHLEGVLFVDKMVPKSFRSI